MSAHVLLNILNKLRKIVRGLPNIVSLFRNVFNKFNKTFVQIYHVIKITLKSHFGDENS